MPLDRTHNEIAENYDRDGFVFPIDLLTAAEVKTLRNDLEAAEAELAGDPKRSRLLREYTYRLLPSFFELVRHPVLIDHASVILGPDLMVWGASLFIKEAGSEKIISWHQDLTYWGLDDAQETTCWVALSDVSPDSGCMRFVPGSHKEQIVPHRDTFAENNMLSRGQEIAVDVDEENAVQVALKPGEASMHHGHLFHASGPNTSADRRIGFAIRYIPTSMKQQTGDKPLASLVSGTDRFSNFTVAAAPQGRLTEEDFALCKTDAELKAKLIL